MGHPRRLELTIAGLLVKLANHYTTRGALQSMVYKFQCQNDAGYIGRTTQRQEIRVEQHVTRELLRRSQETTSGFSQA